MKKEAEKNLSVDQAKNLKAGIDIGSTTAKTVILRDDGSLLFTDYRRHNAQIHQTIYEVFEKIHGDLGDIKITLRVTGSAGMGISERLDIPFIQEIVASAEVTQIQYPDVRTLVDIGGEDSKLILFDGKGRSDIRMNGNCAGGTGAFIDQMAVLLGVRSEDLNEIVKNYSRIHPIASRCGVFAKTDIQALMSRGISSPDIIASVFSAVALQYLNTLSRGFNPKPKVLFTGGPLTFLPLLRKELIKKMKLSEEDIILPEYPENYSAMGAALAPGNDSYHVTISGFLKSIDSDRNKGSMAGNREKPLFENKDDYREWETNRYTLLEHVDLKELDNQECFIGIDSGSTTTKMVLIDRQGRVALNFYTYSKGDHIAAVQEGFRYFSETIKKAGINPIIQGTATTGYGEDFVKTVFDLDVGIVETLAHYQAAHHLVRDVSFILDIGGQDMKAMFIENGFIHKIEINEACSSGCGTFIQTFAELLDLSVEEFAKNACTSTMPCDLGSRCTVFMNSKVKQFLREGAEIRDISAGLAYSVMRNCLNKVLKIKHMSDLGDNILVQGGTFLNPSVHRAFENLTGKKVYCPDIAGLMGAFGCALGVKDRHLSESFPSRTIADFEEMANVGSSEKKLLNCNGCTNQCAVTRLKFDNGRVFYSGNRCERIFSNSGKSVQRGFNLPELKERLIFDRDYSKTKKPKKILGIPRSLNIFENFPFWCTLLVEMGLEVKLSSESSPEVYEKGAGTVMSDSICYPAKMVHGHIIDLVEMGVDRIFYPTVVYEKNEQGGLSSYNCPIVTGYPDVIRSSINPASKYGIPIDSPTISFEDIGLLKKSCLKYFKQIGVSRTNFENAFDSAVKAYKDVKQALRDKAEEIVKKASNEGRQAVILAGRPYHLDRHINHGVPEMLTDLGVDVITDDSVYPADNLDDLPVLTQWAYSNRLYNAGKYAAGQKNVEIVQLNSFGCGLDAIATDILTGIVKESGKNLTVVRIDEIASPGSIKLRLRTMIESLKMRKAEKERASYKIQTTPPFKEEDSGKKILVPYFSKFYSPFVKSAFIDTGYKFKVLPPPDKESLEMGLKYANNEICYPATIVVGDLIKALKNGDYEPGNTAVGITQTGAQCRASNYVALIKMGLIEAGFKDVPVVTVHFKDKELNEQPGFQFSRMDMARTGLYALAFSDALSMIYHSLLVREKIKGNAWATVEKYMHIYHMDEERSPDKVLRLLRNAIDEFNELPVNEGHYPRIGIVGEIYAKYNDFCNHYVVDWLTENNVEVEVPCILNFFTQGFINYKVDINKYLSPPTMYTPLIYFYEKKMDWFLRKVNKTLQRFKFYQPLPKIRELSKKASKVMNLANQYGEGWLIAGEIIKLVESGCENILCLQPFGCIANQVVAKGIEKSMKDLYPNLNILFVDLDANTSEANMFNRLHFLVKSARVSMELNSKDGKSFVA